jgi:hypothetical protein
MNPGCALVISSEYNSHIVRTESIQWMTRNEEKICQVVTYLLKNHSIS